MEKNKIKDDVYNFYFKDMYNAKTVKDYLDAITDIREYDVPYHSRVCIDLDIRMSLWYKITFKSGYID